MDGRNRRSWREDLLEVAVLLPWWGALSLAAVAALLLHGYQSSPVARSLVPGILLAWAAASAIGERRRARREAEDAARESPSVLANMTRGEFDELVAAAFRAQGFAVARAEDADFRLERDGRRYLVQCRHWRAPQLGVRVVRELEALMQAAGAAGGYLLSSGVFSEEAHAHARTRAIQLLDGARLLPIMRETRAAASAADRASAASGSALRPEDRARRRRSAG